MKLTLDTLYRYCTEEGECLLWSLSCNSSGKPQARLDGKYWMVQRYVYSVLCGNQLAEGRRLSAKCGNMRCISPGCLISSTYGGILRRSYATGGRSTLAEYAKRLDMIVKAGRTKLTPGIVAEIRASSETGVALAKKYGVGEGAIYAARNGRSWKGSASSSVFSWRPQ